MSFSRCAVAALAFFVMAISVALACCLICQKAVLTQHYSPFQVGFDSKAAAAASGAAANCFPNQLISLSQIRNYAHQPGAAASAAAAAASAASTDLLHSLKEKVAQ